MTAPDWITHDALQAAFDHSPCLIRGAWSQATSAWSIDVLDRWLTQGGLGWPEVRLFKDGAEIPASRYTVMQGEHTRTDLDALLSDYAAGATVQTIGIDLFHPPVRALCDQVISAFAPHIERIHANAYLTPADARGFDHHWDTHDVIVLQLEGRKHWQVHGAPIPFAAPEQVCGPYRALIDQSVRQDPLIDTVLEPGDLLYLPRGQIHAARTAGACSLHLTLGLHLHTRLSRLRQHWQQAVKAYAQSPAGAHLLSLHGGDEDRQRIADAIDHLACQCLSADAQSVPSTSNILVSNTLVSNTLSSAPCAEELVP